MPGVAAILASLTPSDALEPAAPLPPSRVADEGLRAGSVADRVAVAAQAALAATGNALGAETAERAEAIVAIRTAADVLGPLAARCGTDLDRFLDELALCAEVDTWDPRADRISLLTLHAAKGLEFPVVFIVGCDDGLLPLRSWRGAEVDYAEERRLLFVGMTRATTRLALFTAAKRTLRGEVAECSPSPFLSSVEPALLDRRGGEATGRARRRARPQQATPF
jgi:DNA helicase II / ATP-dependent DNA helicase PcrA